MLGQRLQRWTNIVPTVGQRLVFSESTCIESDLNAMLTQRWATIYGTGTQLT